MKIADIGCGTGASSVILAEQLNAEITAVDFLPEFLDELSARAEGHGLADKISPENCSMDALPFSEAEFDVIWSEGAVYNIGFETGVSYWSRFLKPGGKLVISEITWLTAERPHELQSHWQGEYPEIDVASAKIGILEQNGFSPMAYFYLPECCWTENYYHPLQRGFDDFLSRHNGSTQAQEIIEAEKREISFYEKYKEYYSYGVYIAKKI